jgi:AhpD family alkylhydroperoxidase
MDVTHHHRLNLRALAPEPYRALAGVERALGQSALEPGLRELVKLRASQLNGCAYCLRTHMQAARGQGVAEVKLDVLGAWREADVFDDRERAALRLADEVTRMHDSGEADAAIEAACELFDEAEVASLIFTIAIMNAWNRLHGPAHTPMP